MVTKMCKGHLRGTQPSLGVLAVFAGLGGAGRGAGAMCTETLGSSKGQRAGRATSTARVKAWDCRSGMVEVASSKDFGIRAKSMEKWCEGSSQTEPALVCMDLIWARGFSTISPRTLWKSDDIYRCSTRKMVGILTHTKLWHNLVDSPIFWSPGLGNREWLTNVKQESDMIRLAFQSNMLPIKWRTDWNNKSKPGGREPG